MATSSSVYNAFEGLLPFWDILSENDKKYISDSSCFEKCKKDDVVYDGYGVSSNVILVKKGRLRSIYKYEETKKVTLYWLNASDVCVLCANSVLLDIPFAVTVIAEEYSEIIKIPAVTYDKIKNLYKEVDDFTRMIMAERFSDILYLVQQVVFSPFRKNLASYLIEQFPLFADNSVLVTQQNIAESLGVARSLVAMTLKEFEEAGIVQINRGNIKILKYSELLLISNN